MTTRVRKELALALYTNPSWPLFSLGTKARIRDDVAAYSLTWSGAAEQDDLARQSTDDLQRYIVRAVRNSSLVFQVLIVHLTLQPRSAAVQYRKLWKSLSITAPPAGVSLGPEVQIDCGEKVRFAALATVPASAIDWVLTVMSSFEIAIPIIGREALELDEGTTGSLTHLGLPPGGCREESSIDWPGLIGKTAELGLVAVRRTQNLSNGAISVDFFGTEEDVTRLLRSMESNNDVS